MELTTTHHGEWVRTADNFERYQLAISDYLGRVTITTTGEYRWSVYRGQWLCAAGPDVTSPEVAKAAAEDAIREHAGRTHDE